MNRRLALPALSSLSALSALFLIACGGASPSSLVSDEPDSGGAIGHVPDSNDVPDAGAVPGSGDPAAPDASASPTTPPTTPPSPDASVPPAAPVCAVSGSCTKPGVECHEFQAATGSPDPSEACGSSVVRSSAPCDRTGAVIGCMYNAGQDNPASGSCPTTKVFYYPAALDGHAPTTAAEVCAATGGVVIVGQ